jgi:calcium-dependent protein kinase
MGKTLLQSLMKGRSRADSLGDIGVRLEAKMGKIPFSGRYHREPRMLEDDYVMSQSVLGSGYNGEVRMATSVANPSQKVAVKSLQLGSNIHNFLHKDKLENLEAEVENYLSMDHPHITRLYDVYESKQGLHLVMECMEGGELFDRVIEKKRFSEAEASDALRQMLLALNYIHSHGIVHRDVKLENFIYDSKSSGHLKLIDFGFSKMWDPSGSEKMSSSLGTLSYVAPEVLDKSYTSQCDMWSLGVIAFILLGGYMPFAGNESSQMKNIASGTYKMRPDRWGTISSEAKNFVQSLLEVKPEKRLTAQMALNHPFITRSCENDDEYVAIKPCCQALVQFSHASKFRRCCMEMMAWSLPNEDRAKVRDCFLSLDENHQGTITLGELKHALKDKLHMADDHEILQVFQALDYNHDQEIHYSDFLAAMVDAYRIDVNDEVLSDAFRRFDADNSGYITAENLRDVLGSKVEGERVESFIEEADSDFDGKLSFAEFAAYLRGTNCGAHIDHIAEASVVAEEGVAHKTPNASGKQPGRPGRHSLLKSALKRFKVDLHCLGRPRNHTPPTTPPSLSVTPNPSPPRQGFPRVSAGGA